MPTVKLRKCYVVLHYPNGLLTTLVHNGRGAWSYQKATKFAEEAMRKFNVIASVHTAH